MSYPPRYAPPPRPPATGGSPWVVRIPILTVSGVVLALAVVAALLVIYQMQFTGRALPGVYANGVSLSGMTRDEARAALESNFIYDDQAVFTFRHDDRFWQMTAGELGITFDVEATLDEAFAAGRDGNAVSQLASQASIWLNGRNFAPVVRYDQQATVERLATIAAELNRPAVDATIRIDNNIALTTPSQNGLALDMTGTLAQLETALLGLNTGAEIHLDVIESLPLIRDAEAAAAKVNAALSGAVTLVTDNAQGQPLGPWIASVDQIRGLLTLALVDNGDGTQSYDVTVDTEAFRSFLNSLAPGLISTPQDGRFHFNEETRQLEPIKASVNGRRLDVDATLVSIGQTIFNTANRIVPLVYSYELPRYSSNVTAVELGITSLIAEATTYYSGSTQSRVQNIIESVGRFNGLVIAPGETVSFNYYLGDISPETGFVQGKIIFGGRTIDGVGGGVCQVSTTLFRAALKAGYPIVERNSHGYRVGFYELNGSPPGLDAAIFQPTADFRFLNDTSYHILVETSVFPSDQSIQFRLYSTNPGRQVVLEGPTIRDIVPSLPTIYQSNPEVALGQELYVDWAQEGADVTFTRIILDTQGQEIRRDTIYTHYLPWAAVVQVNPGDSRLS